MRQTLFLKNQSFLRNWFLLFFMSLKFKKKRKHINKPESFWGKIWYFIWYDDSLLSWLVNIILAYVLIKFIVYPLLGLVLGTNYPLVAVVSESMEHDSGFNAWWIENEDSYLALNITKAQFDDYPFKNGFNRGDIMFLIGKDPKDMKIGNIMVFQANKPYPIIHRIIKKENKGMLVFQTKGDNNKMQIKDSQLDETRILETQLLGKAVIKLPYLGYVKIWFVDLLKLMGVSISS